MNKTIAIIFLIIFAVIFIFMLKTLISAFANCIKNLPKGILVLLFLVIIGIMAYLIYYLIAANTAGGEAGNAAEVVSAQAETVSSDASAEEIKDCIILRGDQILINNQPADMESVEQYLDGYTTGDTELVIVDDYSLLSLHQAITELCRERGVEYIEKDEKYLKDLKE